MEVTGKVVYIHEEHHWYRAEYITAQGPQYECFPLPCEPDPPKEGEPEKRYCGPRLQPYKRSFDGGQRDMTQAYRPPRWVF